MKTPLEYSSVPMAPSQTTGHLRNREIRSDGIGSGRGQLKNTEFMRLCATSFLQMRCYNRQFSTTLLTFVNRIGNIVNFRGRLAAPIVAILIGGGFIACGGGGSTTPTGVSKLKDRVF